MMEFNPDLRLVGGHPALDLVNSVAPRLPAGCDHVEFLPGPAELLAWAGRAGVVEARFLIRDRDGWSDGRMQDDVPYRSCHPLEMRLIALLGADPRSDGLRSRRTSSTS